MAKKQTKKVASGMVQLKTATRDEKKPFKSCKYPEQIALSMLMINKSRWELDDENYEFNGKDLIKKPK